MGGLLILGLAIAYVGAAVWLVRRLPRAWMKAIALCAAVLVPTTDAVYGRLKLKQICAEEGGLKVFKRVPSDGFFYSLGADEQYLRRSGFRFMETERKPSGRRVIRRVSLQ